MNFAIKIANGEFILYNSNTNKIKELNNPDVNVENLKNKILEVVKKQRKPIKVRSLIYTSLSLLSGYEVKAIHPSVIEQEAIDPLYQELSSFVLGLTEYQKLIHNTRSLKTSEKEFVISDINGIVSVIPNEDIDLITLDNKVDNIIKMEYGYTIIKTLNKIFTEYFDVNKTNLKYENPIVNYIHQRLVIKFEKKTIVFKNGNILLKIKNDYFPPDSHITVEALKEQIILYVKTHVNTANKNTIIFDSLEELSGYNSNRKASKYVTKYIGENKLKRDVLVEDPLYTELFNFIDTIPEYQENKKSSLKSITERNKSIYESNIIQRELSFLDHNSAFCGTKYTHHVYRPRFPENKIQN